MSTRRPQTAGSTAATDRRPTRRRIMQLLAAAVAAAVAAPAAVRTAEPARSTGNGKTRWIGHC
jgi:hypothetical protein